MLRCVRSEPDQGRQVAARGVAGDRNSIGVDAVFVGVGSQVG